MTRAELKRQKREETKQTKVYHLTEAQIKKIKLDAVREAIEKTFVLLLGLPLIVLRDKEGYGKKRLERFQDYLIEQYKCFDEGYMGLDEVKKVIEEETGCKVREELREVERIA